MLIDQQPVVDDVLEQYLKCVLCWASIGWALFGATREW
jgi:hypothetical protein